MEVGLPDILNTSTVHVRFARESGMWISSEYAVILPQRWVSAN